MELVGVIDGTVSAGIAAASGKAGSSALNTELMLADVAQSPVKKPLARAVKTCKLGQAPAIESSQTDIFQELHKIMKPAGILASHTAGEAAFQ